MQRRTLARLTRCTLLAIAAQAFLTAQSATTKPSLVGSWEFTAKRDTSNTAENIVTGLATFTSDGTAIEADTSEAALHLTPGHGIWQPGPAVGTLFIRFISLIPNAQGALHAKRVVTMSMELSATGDEFSGGYSFEVIDPAGHVLTSGSGSLAGQRIVHPLLP